MRIFQIKVVDKKSRSFDVFLRESGVKRLPLCSEYISAGVIEQGKNFQQRLLYLIEQKISDSFFKGEGRLDKDFLINIEYI